jgi:hypothetical protein
MSRQKSLKELSQEKRLSNIERLVAEIHAKLFFGDSPATNHDAYAIDKKVKEMLKDNFVPLRMMDKKKTNQGMNS